MGAHLIPSARRRQARDLAVSPIRPRTNLGRLGATVVTRIPVARLAVVLAAVGDDAGITVVGVDAAEDAAVDGDHVVDDDVAGTAVGFAVAAAAH